MQYYLTKIDFLPTPYSSFHQGQFKKTDLKCLTGKKLLCQGGEKNLGNKSAKLVWDWAIPTFI